MWNRKTFGLLIFKHANVRWVTNEHLIMATQIKFQTAMHNVGSPGFLLSLRLLQKNKTLFGRKKFAIISTNDNECSLFPFVCEWRFFFVFLFLSISLEPEMWLIDLCNWMCGARGAQVNVRAMSMCWCATRASVREWIKSRVAQLALTMMWWWWV